MLGGYSDHAGRKTPIVSSLIGASVQLIILMCVNIFDLHLGFLILSSAIDGIGGGTCTILMSCFSYISDVTDDRHRSIRVVVLELFGGIAYVASVLGIGYAIAYLGLLWSFVVLLGVNLLALTYVVFLLPESFEPDSDCHLFTSTHFSRVAALFTDSGSEAGPRRCRKVLFCLGAVFLVNCVEMGRGDAMTLFMLSPPLVLDSIWIGYFYASGCVVTNICCVCVTHVFARRFGDLKLIAIGLLSGVGYMLTFGLATNTIVLFLCE